MNIVTRTLLHLIPEVTTIIKPLQSLWGSNPFISPAGLPSATKMDFF